MQGVANRLPAGANTGWSFMKPMSNIPVYVVANFEIVDAETYRAYEKGFFRILRRHGGQFLTYDDATDNFEGFEPLKGRVVIFTFPSEDAARGWYNDPAYQTLSEHRRVGTKLRFLTLVHGLPARS
jgi:uncharacterized protein (DUF1330 family)